MELKLRFWTISIVPILSKKKDKTQRFGDWICLRPQVKD
jgi:hypothetical protein